MCYTDETASSSSLPNKKNIIALEASLQQSLSHLKGLLLDFDQLQIESQNYKVQFNTQQEICESKGCVGSEALKKVIEAKDNIIQSVASALTKLNETKDMNILDEAFKILCGETTILTPPKEKPETKLITPQKELSTSISEELPEESLSEIDGTPGRTSPIIFSKKFRHESSDHREKKKCPDSWPTPETKTVKLTFHTPKGKPGRLKQARFTLVRQSSVNSMVDLTSSPEVFQSPDRGKVNGVQLNIKNEPVDDEDVIQPSPTSLNSNFLTMFKSTARNSPKKPNKNSPKKITKSSPGKFNKRSLTKLQIKTENISRANVENECNLEANITKMEDSINLMRPNRFQTPVKHPPKDPDETDCEIDSSMSLLPRFPKKEKVSPDVNNFNSATKQPLLENINCTNQQTVYDTDSSISLLPKHPVDTMALPKHPVDTRTPSKHPIYTKTPPKHPVDGEMKAKLKEFKPETLFKEPTVRTKAEKQALPGWSCDECKNFYAELYKDDPVMLAKKMDECSKHRGRNNPVRPKTPPGFWNPRWDVPEDTEEFNRRNNAV